MALKDEILCHMWKFTRNDFFSNFEWSGFLDSESFRVVFRNVCSSKRYSSWIN